MTQIAETRSVEQLADGGNLQGGKDLIYVRREASTGVYENVKVTASNLQKGPTGSVYDYQSFYGGALSAGNYYLYGSYTALATDYNLTQASPTASLGTANEAGKGRVFIVVSGVGTSNKTTGFVELEVSGTSVTDDGVRTASDTEILVADIEDGAELALNTYLQTTKSWTGAITITLQNNGSGDATTFSLDFNAGLAQFESANDNAFTINSMEFSGLALANDVDFDVILYKHSSTGWTYSAAGFLPDPTILAQFKTTNSPEDELVAGDYFKFKQSLSEAISGDLGEGYVVMVSTGAANTINYINLKIGIV